MSRSAYYKSLKTDFQTALQEELILELVREQRAVLPMLGVRKLYYLLGDDISNIAAPGSFGRDKLFDLLARNTLLIKSKKRSATTTDSRHGFRKHPNRLKDRILSGPHQAYVCDITYLRTERGFVYLFLITDAYSRVIVGWELSESLRIEGAIKALQMALAQCPDTTGLTHHSDRGIQYCAHEYVSILKKGGVQISMTEQNHCYENALAERVNGILKMEFLLDATFRDVRQARGACVQAIDLYNTRRPHSSLQLRTPMQVHLAAA